MRGRNRVSLKEFFIGGIGISNKNETLLENDSPELYIPNKFYDVWD